MVKYNYIIKAMDLYVTKCPTIAEKKQILSQRTYEDKHNELITKDLLNQGELNLYESLGRSYNELMESYDNQIDLLQFNIKKFKEDGKDYMVEGLQNEIDSLNDRKQTLEDKLFIFERRLIDGYSKKMKDSLNVNENDYLMEKQSDDIVEHNTIGEIERREIDNQRDIGLTDNEVSALQDYYGSDSMLINSKLNDGHYWNSLNYEKQELLSQKLNTVDKNIHNAIKKSNGLTEGTVLFHGGFFDVTKVVGDKIKFKGYTSASFQENVGKTFTKSGTYSSNFSESYTYKILAPKGTKGLCANDTQYGKLADFSFEQEFLLDKNFIGTIVNIDYDNKIVTILGDS